MGLNLALMRDGYLTLALHDLEIAQRSVPGEPARSVPISERLDRARLFVSVAPSHEYTEDEKNALLQFVSDGGIFICAVGYDECGPSRDLLSRFGFYVGRVDDKHPEPKPLGHFKSEYFFREDYSNYVRFHAAWPIFAADAQDPSVLVVSRYPTEEPLILIRRYAKGLVALIGDTRFAANKNLELEGGQAFEGMRENPDFWRYFVSLLTEEDEGREVWYPPKPELEKGP